MMNNGVIVESSMVNYLYNYGKKMFKRNNEVFDSVGIDIVINFQQENSIRNYVFEEIFNYSLAKPTLSF